jgi:CHRD domain
MQLTTIFATVIVALMSFTSVCTAAAAESTSHDDNKEIARDLTYTTKTPAPTPLVIKDKIFFALLNPAQEVPFCTNSTALGNAILKYAPISKKLCVYLSYTNLGAELFSHIHGPGKIGESAGVLFTLSSTRSKLDCFTLNKLQEGYLTDGLLYFNVHTNACMGGALRGQIFMV